MTADDVSPLVSVDWLARNRAEPHVRVVDASWHLPGANRDAAAEFAQGHIPGAVFFDIDRVVDPEATLPHTLPSAEDFARAAGALGIGNDSHVVIYDTRGLFSAARAWWMFRVFGHGQVSILDGGLPAWVQAGQPLETGDVPVEPRVFTARFQPDGVWRLEDVQANLGSGDAVMLDARPEGRFAGRDPEPRPGVRGGHIPGARNLPADRLVDPATGRMHDTDTLAALFSGTEDKPVVCSCGSGVTACALAFALHRLGRDDVAVYDGSWTEWGGRDDTPVATND
ncbi:3-mercaptopyruvate sulfurtransferase [Aquisalimonas asiatica]|uniref:Sulfurtransferase n=1 Tax=Aquisalimonas asiatica TaxID=406100 RepID=A0A1H8VAC2_9GAMM|nr:3-mercaptopyruvate sulfurtransferase [Aquisalimonas asiatica]SEP12356.1 thiosulfate/3-mercaptopyruvate sulfurtransferase [Aquisalimonas asiatica]